MNEKKKMKGLPKRILSFVLTFAMVLALMPGMSTEAYADPEPHYHYYVYSSPSLATIKAECTGDGTCANKEFMLVLNASDSEYSASEAYSGASIGLFDPGYSSNISPFVTNTGITPSISYYKVDVEGATEGGTPADAAILRKTPGYYYASVTVATVTAKAAFSITPVTPLAPAGEEYPIFIYSGESYQQVKESNKNDVLGDGGKVSFDPETNTLTLSGAAICTDAENTTDDAIYCNLPAEETLTINLIGSNVIGKAPSAEWESNNIASGISSKGGAKLLLKGDEDSSLTIYAGESGIKGLYISLGEEGENFKGKLKIYSLKTGIRAGIEPAESLLGPEEGEITIYGGDIDIESKEKGLFTVGGTIELSDVTLNVTANPGFEGVYIAVDTAILNITGSAFHIVARARLKSGYSFSAIHCIMVAKPEGTKVFGSTEWDEPEESITSEATFDNFSFKIDDDFAQAVILHICSVEQKSGQAATCTEDGWKDYYQCTDTSCSKIYASPSAIGTSYADLAAWKASPEGKIERGHSWIYTASGAALTATCESDASHTATLTLTANNAVYSGSAVTASYGDSEAAAWKTAVGSDDPTITYEKKGADSTWSAIASAPSAAGEYRAVAKVTKDSTDYTAYKEFTISKAEISSVTFTAPTVAAAGTPSTATGLAIASAANYTGAISWAPADTSFKYNTVYIATVTLSAKDNYKFADGVTFPTGWTKDASSTETSLVLTKTYDATAKAKITSVTAPSVTTELEAFTTESAQIAALPTSVTVAVEDNSKTSMAITWVLKDGATYSTASEAENTFVWTVTATEYANYDTNSKTLTGEVTLKNPVHQHTWNFTADEAVMTATCTGSGDCTVENGKTTGVTLTLSASDANYSGTAATITLEGKDAWENAKIDVPEIKYFKGTEAIAEAPTTPGNYTAKISAGDPVVTASVDFTISVAKNEAETVSANNVVSKINEIGTVEYTDACKAKIDAARTAYNALAEHLRSLVTNYNVLTTAEGKYAELKAAAEKLEADTLAANAVDTIIKAIGKVEYTDACKAKIDAARKAYDALTADQKKLVKELKTLEDAETAYEALKPEPTPAPTPTPTPTPEAIELRTSYDTIQTSETVTSKGKVTGITIAANSISMNGILTVNANLKVTILDGKWSVAGYSEDRVTPATLNAVKWFAADGTKKDAKLLKKYAKAKYYKATKKSNPKTLITAGLNKKDIDGVYAVKLVDDQGHSIVLNIECTKLAKISKKDALKITEAGKSVSANDILAMADGESVKTISLSFAGKDKNVSKSSFNNNAIVWKVGTGKKAQTIKCGEVTEYTNKKGEVIGYLTLTKDGSLKVLAGSVKGKLSLSATVNGKVYKTSVSIKK